MAIEVEITTTCIIARADGLATEADTEASIASILANPAYHPQLPLLIDVQTAPGNAGGRELAAMGKKFSGSAKGHFSRVAILVASDLVFGLSRTFAAYADSGGLEIRVYRTTEEAMSWLVPTPLR